jgi:hypothetical protein
VKESVLKVGKTFRRDLIRRVQAGDIRYARRCTNSRTLIVVDYHGEEIAFLYSRSTKSILGFVPANAPEILDWQRLRGCRSEAAP